LCGSSLVEEKFGDFTDAIQIQYVQKVKSNVPVRHMYVPILGMVLNSFTDNENLKHSSFYGRPCRFSWWSFFKFLLLVDYIFDWGRDLHRSGITMLLESMSTSNDEDGASTDTDSEVLSTSNEIAT